MPKFGKTAKILIGLLAGIAFGLFFGESCSILQPFSDAFIKILQITVLPFIAINLIFGLGNMRGEEARTIVIKGGAILLLFWAFSAITVAIMRLALPNLARASFFATTEPTQAAGFSLIEILIPYNPFHSLAEGLLPSIVVFCLLLGFAMIGIKKKKVLMSSLNILSLALAKMSSSIQSIIPIGIFVVVANTTGTLTMDRLLELQVFLITSVGFCMLLAFFALPLLISSVTPFSYRELLSMSSGAVILGATTANDFITLPLIMKGVQYLFHSKEKNESLSQEVKTYSEILTPMAFGFPNISHFMAIFFVLFVAWFYSSPLQTADCLRLIAIGIPSIFGPATISIPFLLNFMHLPADAMQLYLSIRPIHIHFLIALSVMSLFSYITLSVAALTNQVNIKWRRLMLSILSIIAVFLLATTGLHSGYTQMLNITQENAQMIWGMSLQDTSDIWLGNGPLETVVFSNSAEVPYPGLQEEKDALERIQKSSILRVGYVPDIFTFSFFNQNGSLVGYDVQMAQDLARFLGVSRLEFIPVTYGSLADDLERGRCDIVMSAVSATPSRLKRMDFSKPYMELHPALVVLDWRKNEFKNLEDVQSKNGLKIAAINGSDDIKTAKILFPNAILVAIDSYEEFFRGDKADAMFNTAEEGAALALLHPYYSVVMLESGDRIIDSYAYPIARSNNQTLLNLLNYWLSLEETHGGLKVKYDYWILGKGIEKTSPRWCMARDVLHWIS